MGYIAAKVKETYNFTSIYTVNVYVVMLRHKNSFTMYVANVSM
jgi:hypothetical protein